MVPACKIRFPKVGFEGFIWQSPRIWWFQVRFLTLLESPAWQKASIFEADTWKHTWLLWLSPNMKEVVFWTFSGGYHFGHSISFWLCTGGKRTMLARHPSWNPSWNSVQFKNKDGVLFYHILIFVRLPVTHLCCGNIFLLKVKVWCSKWFHEGHKRISCDTTFGSLELFWK